MKHIQVQAVTAILAATVASSASAAASINEPVSSHSAAAAAIDRELVEFEPQLELDFLPFGEVSLLFCFRLFRS
jgi:hypothetical protein